VYVDTMARTHDSSARSVWPGRVGGHTTNRYGQRCEVQADAMARREAQVSHLGYLAAKIITKCIRIKSHTYNDLWYRNECHYYIIGVLYKISKQLHHTKATI
jgi:hypothetical protein